MSEGNVGREMTREELVAEIQRRGAEIERLREALAKIRDDNETGMRPWAGCDFHLGPEGMRRVARAALEETT